MKRQELEASLEAVMAFYEIGCKDGKEAAEFNYNINVAPNLIMRGRKEVVEWVENHSHCAPSPSLGAGQCQATWEWQIQKRIWGIEVKDE